MMFVQGFCLFCLLTGAAQLHSEVITLNPSQDATLYEEGVTLQNGLGPNLFVGFTNGANARRSLLAFDIAGNLPPNARVNRVSLTVSVNQVPDIFREDLFGLHRVSAAWQEGEVNATREGRGQAGGRGATWGSTGNEDWSALGGDFTEAASASVLIGEAASYSWESTPQLVADVQSWLEDPQTNFGWAIVGSETERASAKRINSVQNPNESLRPLLQIEFEDIAEIVLGDFDADGQLQVSDVNLLCEAIRNGTNPAIFDLNGDDLVDFDDQRFWVEDLRRTSFGDVDLNGDVSFADFLVLSSNFGQAATEAANWQSGDHDCDGNVGFTDFLLMSANFGQSAEAASVPEPSSKMIALSLLLLLPRLQRRRR